MALAITDFDKAATSDPTAPEQFERACRLLWLVEKTIDEWHQDFWPVPLPVKSWAAYLRYLSLAIKPLESLLEQSKNPELGLFDKCRNGEMAAISRKLLADIETTASALENNLKNDSSEEAPHTVFEVLDDIRNAAVNFVEVTAPKPTSPTWGKNIGIKISSADEASKQELQKRLVTTFKSIAQWIEENKSKENIPRDDIAFIWIQNRTLYIDSLLAVAVYPETMYPSWGGDSQDMETIYKAQCKLERFIERKSWSGSILRGISREKGVISSLMHSDSARHEIRQCVAKAIGVNLPSLPPICQVA